MTDSNDSHGLPAGWDDILSEAHAFLSEALEGEIEAEFVEQSLPPDANLPAEVRMAALSAFTDADLLAEALEGETEAEWTEERLADGTEAARLSPSVRQAALAAFDAADVPAPVITMPIGGVTGGRRAPRSEPLASEPIRSEPIRARRPARLFAFRPVAVAALVLVALGLGFVLSGNDNTAEAGLQLRALSRVDMAGARRMSQVQPRFFAALGRVFTPAEDELLSFDLAVDDTAAVAVIVVGGGDAVRVARAGVAAAVARDLRERDVRIDALLRLESGEARLATREAAVPLAIDGVGLFVLFEGAAHVAIHADGASGEPAVALAEHSKARFYRADGTALALAGPTRVLLRAEGPHAIGKPARSLFRDLRFFGGPLPERTQVRAVSARLFEVRRGRTRRGRQDIRILAEQGPASDDSDHPGAVRLAWRVPPVLSDARTLRVALRAPEGTRVSLDQIDGASPSAVVTQASVASKGGPGAHEPGTRTVDISLQAGWYDLLPAGRLELIFELPPAAAKKQTNKKQTTNKQSSKGARRRKAVRAWFDGISLVLGPSQNGLPVGARHR